MNKHVSLPILVAALALSLAACSFLREGMEGHQEAAARVAGRTLTVQKAAEYVGIGFPRLTTPELSAVDRIADLWVGYTLLALELASPDTFADVDVSPMIDLALGQDMVWRLHDDVIAGQVDSSEAALRAAYERDQPYTRVIALHILISTAAASTQTELDSMRRHADSIRARAAAGEDFEDLASAYSQDPASASQGGRLGWVEHGRLLPELESIVFNMEPGTVSETVRSRLGYHIFKVTDRESPDFESVRDRFSRSYTQSRVGELETAYLDSLFEAGDVRFADGAAERVKRLADSPGLERLGPAARAGVLAKYRGGTLTVGEWVDFVKRGEPESRRLFAVSDTVTVLGYLREMVRNKLLIKAASDLGYEVPAARRDSIRAQAHRELLAAARQAGMQREALLDGRTSIADAVNEALLGVGRNRRRPWSLDRVTMALRLGQSYQVYPHRYAAVLDWVEVIREGGVPAAERMPTPPAEESTEDTSHAATDAEN